MTGRRTRRWVLASVFAAAIAAIGLYIGYSSKNNNASNNNASNNNASVEPTQIRIGYSRLRISLPLFVAQENRVFERHGLKVELQAYDTAQPLMQALVEGKLEIGGYTAFPITFSGMLRSQKQLYFVTTLIEDDAHRITYLLRPKPASGEQPKIVSIADLKGKRIGILPTIAYQAWLRIIASKNGLDPENDITVQQIAPEQQALALKNGAVDALLTNDPMATSMIKAGIAEPVSDEVVVPRYIMNPFPFGSFNVSKEWADSHPKEFKALVAALNEAVAFVNDHPNDAKQAMIPYIPEQFRNHVDSYPDAKYLTTKQTDEGSYKQIVDLYVTTGVIERPVDLTDLVVKE